MGKDPKEADPQIRVVDRHWWARPDRDEPADERGARKPSYVEDLERQVAEQGAQLQAFSADHRRSLEEFAQDETVVAVMREGYAIGDELLRPASVILGRLEPQG